MHADPQSPNSSSNAPGVACGGLFSVAAAVEFARQRGGDCTNLITFVALQETGMLDAYMMSAQRKTDRPAADHVSREIGDFGDDSLRVVNSNGVCSSPLSENAPALPTEGADGG